VSRPGRPPEIRSVHQAELQASIFLRAGDLFHGRPLYQEIIDRARSAGLSGATAVRGLQGFGDSGLLRSAGLIGRGGFEPVRIEIADDPARVRAFLPELDRLLGSGLIVLKTVTVTRRVAGLPDIAATAAP
jgi:PII-like signaling protein